MSLLPIYTYDQPILRQKAKPVTEINGELKEFIQNMFETMDNADGVGLAANQVGSNKAIAVLNLSDIDDESQRVEPFAIINPIITAYSDETNEYEEGCLSLPKLRDKVVRPSAIELQYFDIDMHEHKREIDGFLARVIQHEIDHLNGIYFFERLSPIRKALATPALKRIQKGLVSTDYPLYRRKK